MPANDDAITHAITRAIALAADQCAAGTHHVVAYSGGLDSSVLLHAAAKVLSERGHDVRACHVHHGLSPHADAWATHCQATCARLGIACRVIHVSVPRDDPAGLEDAARRARHLALDAQEVDWLWYAHHADDQAETVLLNLLRGTGILGLAGMSQRQGRRLRPLLELPRSTLERYARHHGLEWVEDESNADPRLARNAIRHAVLPALKDHQPAATQLLARSAARAGEAQALLVDLANIDDPRGDLRRFPLPLAAVRALPPNRLANLLRQKLLANALQSPPHARLSEFVRQILSAAPDRHPELSTRAWRLTVADRHIHLEGADTPPTT